MLKGQVTLFTLSEAWHYYEQNDDFMDVWL